MAIKPDVICPHYIPCSLIAQIGHLAPPFLRPVGILEHAFAIIIAVGQIIFRTEIAQIGRLAIPFHRLFIVLANAVAFIIAHAQQILRISIALIRRPAIPIHSTFLILFHTFAIIITFSQIALRSGIACNGFIVIGSGFGAFCWDFTSEIRQCPRQCFSLTFSNGNIVAQLPVKAFVSPSAMVIFSLYGTWPDFFNSTLWLPTRIFLNISGDVPSILPSSHTSVPTGL